MSTDSLINVNLLINNTKYVATLDKDTLINGLEQPDYIIRYGDTKHGDPEGKQIYIDANGHLKGTKNYENGVIVGSVTKMDENESLKTRGEYVNGECVEVQSFFINDIILTWIKEPKDEYTCSIEDTSIQCLLKFNVDNRNLGQGACTITDNHGVNVYTLKDGIIMEAHDRSKMCVAFGLLLVFLIVFLIVAYVIYLWLLKKLHICS